MTPEQTQALTAIAEARDALQRGDFKHVGGLLDLAAQRVWAIQTTGYSQQEMDEARRLTPKARQKTKAYMAMLRKGCSLAEVGARFGKDPSAVHSALRRAGLPTSAAKCLATVPRTKKPVMPNNPRHFDRMEAYALIRQGLKLDAIARHFDVSTAAIQQGLTRAGLPSSGKKYRIALEAGTLERDYPGTAVTA